MIELFAKLINTHDRVSIERLIRRSIQVDEFVRENTSLQYIEQEESLGSENFFFIDDQQASIKRDVYLSFFVYKMLLTMKRYQKKYEESHQLIVIDEIEGDNSILENHVYRIISKIQDAEYEVTEKSPRAFMHKPTTETLQSDGVKAIEFTLEGLGKISVVAFGKRRGLPISEAAVVSDYINNGIKGLDTVTHFYKLDMALRDRLSLASGAFSAKCSRILEESLPEKTIRYLVFSPKIITKDSYAERNALNLAIQAKEMNVLLIRQILQDMHGRLGMNITEDDYVVDPISKKTETKILCKVMDHREYLSWMTYPNPIRTQDGLVRGWGSQGSQRFFSSRPSESDSRFMGLDFGRQQGDLVAMFRYEQRNDPDGDGYEIRAVPITPEESIRESFLRDWLSK